MNLDTAAALSTVPTTVLEDRLACLAGRIAAAECEFLELLAELDRRGAWGDSGMRSAAHWLSWRTGMRLGVARERVRVARSLRTLPIVRDAFAAGRLSYCKVRALSRVATAPTEADLVDIALGATGAQLERVCRAWRGTLVAEQAAAAHLTRGVRRRQHEDGTVVYTMRLAPEESALFDAGLAAARCVVLDEQGDPVETPEEAALAAQLGADPPHVRSEADAVVLLAESFLSTGARGEPGDHTLVVVHADLAALARDEADGVSAETPSDDSAGATDHDAARQSPDVSAETSDAGAVAPVHQRSLARRPPGASLDTGHRLSPGTVLRMLCHSPAQLMVHAADGRPLDLGRTRRNANRAQRRALRVRDGGCCRFPGCTQRRRLIPHHTHWWTRGGRTDLDLLVLVCPTHHRAVHEVGYSAVALGNGAFCWRRPDGREMPESPDTTGSPEPAVELTRAPVTVDTITPTWGGEPLDLDHLVSGLAANLLTDAGNDLTALRYHDLQPALRRAAGWPDAA